VSTDDKASPAAAVVKRSISPRRRQAMALPLLPGTASEQLRAAARIRATYKAIDSKVGSASLSKYFSGLRHLL
jgi:hypothetical protein